MSDRCADDMKGMSGKPDGTLKPTSVQEISALHKHVTEHVTIEYHKNVTILFL